MLVSYLKSGQQKKSTRTGPGSRRRGNSGSFAEFSGRHEKGDREDPSNSSMPTHQSPPRGGAAVVVKGRVLSFLSKDGMYI